MFCQKEVYFCRIFSRTMVGYFSCLIEAYPFSHPITVSPIELILNTCGRQRQKAISLIRVIRTEIKSFRDQLSAWTGNRTGTVRTTVSWTCNNQATERRGFSRQFDHDVSKLFASYLFVSVRCSVQIMFGSVRIFSAARENAFYFSLLFFSQGQESGQVRL